MLDASVFVKNSMQLELRQNGETYDLICLSNMKSDYEWFAEKELT